MELCDINRDNYLEYDKPITTIDEVKYLSTKVNCNILFQIIRTISDEQLKIKSIPYCRPFIYRILSEIKDSRLIVDFLINDYDKNYSFSRCDLIKFLKLDDNNITKIINNVGINADLIILINSNDIRRQYIIKYLYSTSFNKYSFYKLLITSYSPEYIYNLILRFPDYIDLLDLIDYLLSLGSKESLNYAKELGKFINIPGIQTEYKSQIHNYMKKKLNNMRVDIPNIDKTITFGIELEAKHKAYKFYNMVGTLMNRWNVKNDLSFDSSTEIASPILHSYCSDLKQLKFACDFMSNNGFITNEECGGHIHIGLDTFKSGKELSTLYYIFGNCEYIFFQISNRKNTVPRDGIDNYAKTISPLISRNWNRMNNFEQVDLLIKRLKEIQGKDRYYDINILNAGTPNKNTIEFRFPNGEISYDELMNNVLLITRLVERSKELAHIDSTDSRYKNLVLLGSDLDEQHKLELLLDLLFSNEDEKNIYRERFNSNEKLTIEKKHTKIKDLYFKHISL